MAIGWVDVIQWRAAPLFDAYSTLNRVEGCMESSGDLLRRAESGFTSEGQAAEAARISVGLIAEDMTLAESQLTALMADVREAAFGVEEIEYAVRDTIAFAGECMLTISPYGRVEISQAVWDAAVAEVAQRSQPLTVIPQPDLPAGDPASARVYRIALENKTLVEEKIASVLEQADYVDRQLMLGCDHIAETRETTLFRASAVSDPDTGLSDVLGHLDDASKHSVSEVRALWDSLDPATQAALIAAYPAIIGAMNGIPFASRVEANRVTAKRRLDEISLEAQEVERALSHFDENDPYRHGVEKRLADLEAEINYLSAVLETPGRGFILYDPVLNRIIEQNGAVTDGVSEVYTHVPGTGTGYSSFVTGSVTEFPKSLRSAANEEGLDVATFTYMDGGYEGSGPWIAWPYDLPSSARANTSMWHFDNEGMELAEFQAAVRQESSPVGADVNIGGHSAGMGPIFYAENHGARFDQVDSLAGSTGFSSDWVPNKTTDYNHHYYSPEAINAVQIAPGVSPYGHDAFDKYRYDGGGPLENHNRVGTGEQQNSPVINQVIKEMRNSGK
ncbi:hypothetical protein [Gulosibacter hominis]|uniref:hypothetical protein n=1 Tax=Gulosibacter hominis TaxID=2770504 RepID=UPI00191993AA|nr:hypothetical protein [Gulosibacter hominis]